MPAHLPGQPADTRAAACARADPGETTMDPTADLPERARNWENVWDDAVRADLLPPGAELRRLDSCGPARPDPYVL